MAPAAIKTIGWLCQTTSILFAKPAQASSICDFPDMMVSSTMTAGQYCRRLDWLNLLVLTPSIIATWIFLQAPPSPRIERHSNRGQRSRLLSPPRDPGIVGLQLLFHTSWMTFDRKYPSGTLAATSTSFLLTWPIVIVVALLMSSKRSMLFSISGGFWTSAWFIGVLMWLFPRLNWTLNGARYAFKDTNIPAFLMARLRQGHLWTETGLLFKGGLAVLFVLGSTLLLLPTSTREAESISRSGLDGKDVELHDNGATPSSIGSRRFTTNHRQYKLDLTAPGYGFIILATMLLLAAVYRPIEAIQRGDNIRSFAALPKALWTTSIGCIIAGMCHSEQRRQSVRLAMLLSGVLCFCLAVLLTRFQGS